MTGTRRATLPRGERLRERREFERLFRRGARVERVGFVLVWISAMGPRAAAFAAGRRLGGSVVRNRARRRLREAYRRQRGEIPAHGIRLGFIAKPGALTLPFGDLCGQVGGALTRIAR